MSSLLYRIGKFAYRKSWLFVVGWVAILAIVVSLIGVNGLHINGEMKIEGTESQRVLDQLAETLPQAAGGQGSIVIRSNDDTRLDDPQVAAAIAAAVMEVYQNEYVLNPTTIDTGLGEMMAMLAQYAAMTGESPMSGYLMLGEMPVIGVTLSDDGQIGLFQFQFNEEITNVPQDVKDALYAKVKELEASHAVSVLPSESLMPVEIEVGSGEIIGVVVAAIVLFIALGSIVAAGLPLITALIGVGIGVGGAFALSSVLEMTSVTAVLGLMVGMAVGIDYALFILNRQRRMILDQRLDAWEATGRAVGTAGSAVFFAGLTVIIALCGMLVIDISFLSIMALVAAATVFINVLLALTLLPALLGLVGERICSQKARDKAARRAERVQGANAVKGNSNAGNTYADNLYEGNTKVSNEDAGNARLSRKETYQSRASGAKVKRSFSERWVSTVVKYRWLVIIVIVIGLGAAALPATKMELGIPGAASANLDTPERQTYDAITDGFGEGHNGPLIVVAEFDESGGTFSTELALGFIQQLQQIDNVSTVSPLGMSPDGSMMILSLIPETGPTDHATNELVTRLRTAEDGIIGASGIKLGVTGFTAINIDMSEKLADVFPIYIGIIVIFSLIILLLVFRSVVIPIKATLGFLLSILATFGLATAVFQWGWMKDLFGFDTSGPLLSFMPIIITGILYGLAMDYQVFLVSAMRESYVHGHKSHAYVTHGFNQASRVVLAAAVIMVSVFAGFIFTGDILIKQIGFTLTIGILFDAFIVRMTFVPAIMAVFRNTAWWIPRWLDRLLPNMDVEGDKLLAALERDRSH